jgi:tRNA(fMet)-specific endonuclease VapC
MQAYAAIMQRVKLLSVDDTVAHRAADIGNTFRKQGRRIGPLDLLVAATALVQGLTLVTHSQPVFAHAPGLVMADWHIP